MPTGTMAGMAAKNKEPGQERSAGMVAAVEPIHTAATPAAAEAARDEMLERRSGKYPTLGSLWLNVWERSVPSLDYDGQIRQITSAPPTRFACLNVRFRRSIRARGHFPNE